MTVKYISRRKKRVIFEDDIFIAGIETAVSRRRRRRRTYRRGRGIFVSRPVARHNAAHACCSISRGIICKCYRRKSKLLIFARHTREAQSLCLEYRPQAFANVPSRLVSPRISVALVERRCLLAGNNVKSWFRSFKSARHPG